MPKTRGLQMYPRYQLFFLSVYIFRMFLCQANLKKKERERERERELWVLGIYYLLLHLSFKAIFFLFYFLIYIFIIIYNI
jgi:hypothetical protein